MSDTGRFQHHPDPAIDFCTEVDALAGLKADITAGVATDDEAATFPRRIERALAFKVGGDVHAINAKHNLRKLADMSTGTADAH